MKLDWPSTLSEAVDHLMLTLAPDQLDAIRYLSEGELIGLHFSLGLYIRNTFSLWQRNESLLGVVLP